MASVQQRVPAEPRGRSLDAVQALKTFVEQQIRTRAWPPGHKVPTERELEKQFGVSRNTLRKTLKDFENDGRITRHVGRGSFVAAPTSPEPEPAPQRAPEHAVFSSRAPVEDASDGALVDKVLEASPSDIMDIRLLLEPAVAELAAGRATARDLTRMRECLVAAEEAVDPLEFEHWDGMLHETIVGAARNELLTAIYVAINKARLQPEWQNLKLRTVTADRRAEYQRQHAAVVNAIGARDASAARDATLLHLQTVTRNLLGR